MFEELQDYKVKICKGLQDYICLEGLQDYRSERIRLQDYKKKVEYKSLSERERESYYKVFLKERESYLVIGPKTWTLILDLSSIFGVCPFIDKVNHGKSSKSNLS